MDLVSKPKLVLPTIDDNTIADTGTTGHFLSNNAPTKNKKNGECINVGIPNGQTMSSSLTTALHHPKLSKMQQRRMCSKTYKNH